MSCCAAEPSEVAWLTLALLLAIAGGCGQTASRIEGEQAKADGENLSVGSSIVLYRDGLMVTRDYSVAFDVRGEARVENVRGRSASARLRDGHALSIKDEGIGAIASERSVHGDRGLILCCGRPGERGTVTIASWLDEVSWKAGYTVVVEGNEDESRGQVSGWLTITSKLNRAFAAPEFWILGSRPPRERANENLPKGPTPPAGAAALRVSSAVVIPAHDIVRVALPISAAPVAIWLRHRFDANRGELAHQGAAPILERSFATEKDNVRTAVVLSLIAQQTSGQGWLPHGPLNVVRRSNGQLRSLGVISNFGGNSAAKSTSGPLVDLNSALELGDSPGLSGRRWQQEFAIDRVRKRVVEEIRVEITNETGEARLVEVLERQARGLNWSLAYHNEPGSVEKIDEQVIRFELLVPPNGSKLVVYRVVYFWK